MKLQAFIFGVLLFVSGSAMAVSAVTPVKQIPPAQCPMIVRCHSVPSPLVYSAPLGLFHHLYFFMMEMEYNIRIP